MKILDAVDAVKRHGGGVLGFGRLQLIFQLLDGPDGVAELQLFEQRAVRGFQLRDPRPFRGDLLAIGFLLLPLLLRLSLRLLALFGFERLLALDLDQRGHIGLDAFQRALELRHLARHLGDGAFKPKAIHALDQGIVKLYQRFGVLGGHVGESLGAVRLLLDLVEHPVGEGGGALDGIRLLIHAAHDGDHGMNITARLRRCGLRCLADLFHRIGHRRGHAAGALRHRLEHGEAVGQRGRLVGRQRLGDRLQFSHGFSRLQFVEAVERLGHVRRQLFGDCR
ncbi:MAG: hypothetical protein BWX70_03409 [Verrucomicrobia bacterium ADurb.Bin070]|nr:MAG: hypothetical protein BWX70_03409 [Verrucomicrobia bacterium ADurb.Bin070]